MSQEQLQYLALAFLNLERLSILGVVCNNCNGCNNCSICNNYNGVPFPWYSPWPWDSPPTTHLGFCHIHRHSEIHQKRWKFWLWLINLGSGYMAWWMLYESATLWKNAISFSFDKQDWFLSLQVNRSICKEVEGENCGPATSSISTVFGPVFIE